MDDGPCITECRCVSKIAGLVCRDGTGWVGRLHGTCLDAKVFELRGTVGAGVGVGGVNVCIEPI